MAIPFRALERAVQQHPDDALVALPVSLVREILATLPARPIVPVAGARS
jgi:hypothetical protein